jgi:hypothetical protein
MDRIMAVEPFVDQALRDSTPASPSAIWASATISTACGASNKGLGVEASNGLVPFTRNESGELIGGLAGD